MKRKLNQLFIVGVLLFSQTAWANFQSIDSHLFDPKPNALHQFFSKIWECTWHISCYQTKLGAFTTLNSTDRQGDFPTTYNANLVKTIEIGTTSVASITTLPGLTSASSLATVGTITSGTWNGTVIGVAYNGTGTTSPTTNQVILGNGSSGFKVVNGFGNSGQFLQSAGASTPPLWATSAVDQAAAYTWTGKHIFQSATTTFSNGLEFGIGIGTTSPAYSATFAIEAESGNKPAFLILDARTSLAGTSTPVFRIDNGASTTFAFDRTQFNQCTVRAEQNVTTTLGNTSTTTIAFELEEFDTCGMHDLSVSNSRLTAKYAGYYQVNAGMVLTHNRTSGGSTGFKSFLIKNGAKVYAQEQADIEGTAGFIGFGSSLSAVIHLEVNDYVELAGWENQGDSDTVFPQGTYISATLVGK